MVEISEADFADLVDAALATIPPEFRDHMRNIAILIEDLHPSGPGVLGLYTGIPLPERQFGNAGYLPDTITIYREALKRFCTSREQLAEQVRITVIHEVGHYFGFDDEELHARGY
ncbi:metallopeptidase family protein [Corynebacterium sp. ES2794-CONJ1]|uniref:metallopeptidase family protein n=1 Tax=unclassified Corynebacterium TaxID=2624378 RepID=UPI0021693A8C|nr:MULTISPECIES: metallopeptidase family protein [unclassified Corynebacterium]MCS4490121.1 metallopeptidase family protein [Corynebacterium sp. ES2775-CONJ]MCS4492070.1 metallopeptidase family protein [Corynebacterium sp. ES2715-CONJ3]MCS4532178.1 metallopeptidase family protein [Corynebacterium sp. ES2730-CONJ]MCU9519574.1 metallopeptidase family protein [Corynebacterium sp. ES2794-CONJ1]